MRLVNLTGSDVMVYADDHYRLLRTYPCGDRLARLFTTDALRAPVDGVEVVAKRLGQLKLLDLSGNTVGDGSIPREPNTLYIVSLFVLQHAPRVDFLAPDTTARGAVRDEDGQLLGTTRFLGC